MRAQISVDKKPKVGLVDLIGFTILEYLIFERKLEKEEYKPQE